MCYLSPCAIHPAGEKGVAGLRGLKRMLSNPAFAGALRVCKGVGTGAAHQTTVSGPRTIFTWIEC